MSLIAWNPSPLAKGTVMSYPVNLAGGANKNSNAFSFTLVIISAETENDLTASWTTKSLPVFNRVNNCICI